MATAKFSIKTTSSIFLVLCLTVFTLSCFADPDALQDFCVADLNSTVIVNGFPCKPVSEVTANDFYYSGLMNEASTDNRLGLGVRSGDVNNFPGINTLGLMISRVDLAPGGIIPIHTHPRATEANYVIQGEVYFGFISTSNVLYSKVLKAGEMSIIPKGLVHFVQNVGPKKAVVLAIFNSQLPGTASLPNNLFGSDPALPNDLLAKNFQADEKVIASIKSKKKAMAAKSSIKTTLSFFLVLCLPVILSFTLSCFADPDELQDFCVADLNATKITMNGFPCKPLSEVKNDDFFYSGLVNEANTDNPFGVGIRPGDVTSFPALNTLELTIDVLDLAPGANVPVHTHPRGSEANLVIKGKHKIVLFGFITTNNVLYSKVLNAGELSVIPKGLVHFVQKGCPSVIPFNLFGSKPAIPNDILAKNFLVDDKVIASIKSNIKTTSSCFLVLCLTVFTLSCFADPDELQDFCVADLNSTTIVMNGFPCKPMSQVTTEDFFYSGLVNEASTANPFGLGVRPGDVTSFPGLNTLGLSINILDLAPGGIVPLHTHPRATEANLVIKGKVFFGFLTTNNVLHSKVITAGEVSIIPEGLVHFVQNVGKSKAVVVAMFNSQSPGAAGLPFNLFGSTPAIPNDLLAKNFLVDEKVIANIKSNIITTSSFFLVLCLTVFTLSCFADPDELQDFCVADLNSSTIVMNGFPCKPMSQVTTEDFFYSGLVNEASTANPFGLGVRPGDVTSFPGLNTLGLSINILDLAPGGIVPLHTHPRATEANLVIKGKVFFGFLTTNNVLHSKVIKAGEVSIIPKGLVHFVQNVGKSKAVVVAMFNSQSPGAAGLPFNLFGSTPAIPNDLLAKNFLVDEKVIANIKSKFGN
ncbi:hypothetical protein MKW92_019594 [Papaver armeniacum]|nr:hypothetical protein MKW92_019594 [Papaver armeniacum]